MENLNSSTGLRILIVTDAWRQINGVVTTLENLNRTLTDMGHDIDFLNYDDADYTCDMPFYPEVKLAYVKQYVIKRKVNWADAIHIATPEGPIGFKTLRYCVKNKIPFTTGYHTKWPEFVRARLPIPTSLTYAYMRWLHKHSKNILVPTQTVVDELGLKGFNNLCVWTRGVDRSIFNSGSRTKLNCGRPLLLCVTRVSHEKGLDDFCKIDYPGATKIIVGDGPYRKELEAKLVVAEQESKQTNTVIQEKIVKQKEFVKGKTEYITRYIDKEIIKKEEIVKYIETCPVPKEIIELHNAATEMNKAAEGAKK